MIPTCAEYAAPGHPEAPFRVLKTAELLTARHPDWFPPSGKTVPLPPADDAALLRAHTPAHLARLHAPEGPMFDPDTAALPGMDGHARRAAGAAMGIAALALEGKKAFSLLRPPGHHATADRIMGFCYLNSAAVAALHARQALGADAGGRVGLRRPPRQRHGEHFAQPGRVSLRQQPSVSRLPEHGRGVVRQRQELSRPARHGGGKTPRRPGAKLGGRAGVPAGSDPRQRRVRRLRGRSAHGPAPAAPGVCRPGTLAATKRRARWARSWKAATARSCRCW